MSDTDIYLHNKVLHNINVIYILQDITELNNTDF